MTSTRPNTLMIPGTSVIPRIEISGPPNNDVHKAPSLKPHDGSPEVPEAIIKSPTCVDRNEYLKKKVGALFETYTNAKKLELSVLTLIEANFSGDKLNVFVDSLCRKVVCDRLSEADQCLAAVLVKSLIQKGLITKFKVLDVIKNGVIKDIAQLMVLPEGTRDFAAFLTELFYVETDLTWLTTIVRNLPYNSHAWIYLIQSVIETLKRRLPLLEVEKLIRKTQSISLAAFQGDRE